MQQKPPDIPRLARHLEEAEVRYVLVGGLALALRGGQYITFDADLAIAFDVENRERVVRALASLNPRPLRLAPGAQWVWDKLCVIPPWSLWETDAGRVDLLVRLPGIDSFQGLHERSTVFDLGEARIRVASLDDLIVMKSQSNREKDKIHLVELLALQKMGRDPKRRQ